ncbi:hypothetical protein [Streptomyces roseifaciens]|uniref:hypothetical protein n=1 Tax=Streptomyces roseifaciens TaxID=1488406 RepID=UPI000717ED55|nr:hypothetical protein [Streptomyces roseifaciens]
MRRFLRPPGAREPLRRALPAARHRLRAVGRTETVRRHAGADRPAARQSSGSSPPRNRRLVAAVAALTVLYEPVLLSLRRLAHAEESARRFAGGEEPA